MEYWLPASGTIAGIQETSSPALQWQVVSPASQSTQWQVVNFQLSHQQSTLLTKPSPCQLVMWHRAFLKKGRWRTVAWLVAQKGVVVELAEDKSWQNCGRPSAPSNLLLPALTCLPNAFRLPDYLQPLFRWPDQLISWPCHSFFFVQFSIQIFIRTFVIFYTNIEHSFV